MRNLIFAFLTVFAAAGISACDDNNNMNVKLPDLAASTKDLSTPLNGCNGFEMCRGQCITDNCPTVGGSRCCCDDSSQCGDPNCAETAFSDCFDACVAGSTDHAIELWWGALIVCPGVKLCGPGKTTDQGSMPCTADEVSLANNTTSNGISDLCNACIDDQYNALGQSIFTSATACGPDWDACFADTP